MNKYQKGYFNISTAEILFGLAIVGCIGWVIIEGVLWVASHIHFGWQ